jgi:hypothetical protein
VRGSFLLESLLGLIEMTTAVTLGGSANGQCPTCLRAITFFSAEKGAFISDVKIFADDKVIQLMCPAHGTFGVRAGDFSDKL